MAAADRKKAPIGSPLDPQDAMTVASMTAAMQRVLGKQQADQKVLIQKLIREELERATPGGLGGASGSDEVASQRTSSAMIAKSRTSRKDGPSGGGGEKAMQSLMAGDLISLRVEGEDQAAPVHCPSLTTSALSLAKSSSSSCSFLSHLDPLPLHQSLPPLFFSSSSLPDAKTHRCAAR